MKFAFNDGGRAAAGFAGKCGDCVTRAVAIATGLPYAEVYAALAQVNADCRQRKRASYKRGVKSARNGVAVTSAAFKRYMASLGWTWTPTMGIGTGCRVHLTDGELPMGRLIVSVSKHYTTIIDGVINDLFDPQRETHVVTPDRGQPLKLGEWRNVNGVCSVQRRCVYGYWSKAIPTTT